MPLAFQIRKVLGRALYPRYRRCQTICEETSHTVTDKIIAKCHITVAICFSISCKCHVTHDFPSQFQDSEKPARGCPQHEQTWCSRNLACRIFTNGSRAQPLICHVMSRSGSFAIIRTSLLGHCVTGVCGLLAKVRNQSQTLRCPPMVKAVIELCTCHRPCTTIFWCNRTYCLLEESRHELCVALTLCAYYQV
jgi:hypothetical protein